MPKRSAGLLVYRVGPDRVEVLLVHPGGPYWARRDEGAWSIPKGEYAGSEEPLAAALREFREELGFDPPPGPAAFLDEVRQPSGKLVSAWAVRDDAGLDAGAIRSNTFTMEWPPGSGRTGQFPEVDRAGWFGLDEAGRKLVSGQAPLLERLAALLGR